jgi:hypothetical protein
MTHSPKSANKNSFSPLNSEWRRKHRALIEKIELRLKAGKFMDIIDETRERTPLQRFSRLVEAVNLKDFDSKVRNALLDLAKIAEPHAEWQSETFNLSDDRVFFLYANNFIILDEKSPADFPMVEAFRRASFDSANPAHW